MADTSFDWRSFLDRWSEEWADSWDPAESLHPEDEEARRTRRLGFDPAPATRIAALEERLGRRLPPSYREFLDVTDGWRHAGGFVWLLAGTEGVRWHEDEAGLAELYEEELDEDSTPEMVLLAGMWTRALQLDAESDATYVLLDPMDVDADGEWAVYYCRAWAGDLPERYASFREFMVAMHRGFHSLRAGGGSGREFVNATTRALDAALEVARRDALGGAYERAETELANAQAYGRPRARALRDQIRRLLGETYLVNFGGHAVDPVYASELLPALADLHVHNGHDDAVWSYHFGSVSDEVRASADELLRRVRDRTYRYTAQGAFGRAVDTAREQARCGETGAAWRTLLAALPTWQPVGPDHLAPLGLLADPILGPLITPERGRELLATPRGGEHGSAPVPPADLDPAWGPPRTDDAPSG
ncbi:SMI1/KNR4 family protein [Embleya sp. NBC_00896]|uniref:SMI1/KNR4 family protein n=1 Tax=Embleya sp. NBC_00896 TaxID=2975961 RepID=UPI002F9147D9|nr:SMI1/KNR4 family protein [Embleya sp. NBC_00896]